MSIRRSTLIGAAVAAALCHEPLHSQESGAGGEAIEEVVVTSYRASLQQSLENKRNASSIVESVTAEDIGKFPDKNVAESLQRVTGISIMRDFGEGERVAIRGTAPNLNRTLLNGHAIATADWFVLDQLAATRSFNYLMLPSEIVGELEVFKSPQADIEEGGIGGTINVRTRNPLDLAPFTFSASVQAARTDLADSTDPQASALISWKNSEETFGILAAALYQERQLRRDGIEFLGYSDRPIAEQGGAELAVPDLVGSALFDQERVRKGGNIGLQFRPSEKLQFNLTALYSEMDADNFNQNYMAWFNNMFQADEQPTGTVVGADGTLVAGTFARSDDSFGVVFDAILRDARTETSSIDLAMDFTPNESWKVRSRIGVTQAEGETSAQPFWETQARTGFTWDFRNGVPEISFTDLADPTAEDSLPILGWSSNNRFLNEDDEFYFYADAERKVDVGAFTGLRFGVKYTDHERDVNITYGQTRMLLTPTGCGGAPCGLQSAAGGLTPGNFLGDIAAPGTVRQFRLVDPNALREIFGSLDYVVYDPNNPQHVTSWDQFPILHRGPLESFNVQEEAVGGYVMGVFEGEGWRGNVGVRIVETKQTSTGWNVGVPAGTPGAEPNPFGLIAPIRIDNDYTDVLPSLNIAFELSDDLVMRVAAARVMARPDYNRIAPTITSTTPLLLTGTGGNPNLDPYRANQFDVSFEWYFAPESLLSAAFFYKDLQSYIVNGTGPERLPTEINDPNDARLNDPDADCQPSGSSGIFNCIYQIDRPVNGSGGRNQGVEISYQQPLWNGFGVLTNYTYSDAKADNGDPIPSNSKHTVNLTAFYENPRFSARLSYNYRSEFFIDIDRGRELYSDDIKTLDASINVNVTDNVALTFDGVNLTDEELFQYYDNNRGRPARYYDNGPIYYAGVRVRF
ncbi:MAG TPA: TonB-dependent receptor [Steroidobacteraceae bacterium]